MDLRRHPLFTAWQDPQTGVESFVLTRRVAPVQQAFYFVNNGVSADERWLWFYCGHPPGRAHTLGVVSLDPADPVIRHFPGAQFTAETPLLTAEGAACYFAHGGEIWLQHVDGRCERVFALPGDFVAGRQLHRLATHLTLSADGKHFLLDVDIGNEWVVGLADRASGTFTPLKSFGRKYNHVQFSPHDPNLFIIAQDWWRDPITGRFYNFDQRTWLMTADQTRFEPIRAQGWFGHGRHACHEWWAADGTVCWVDYQQGAMELAPDRAGDAEATLVWGPRPLCHAQCNADRSLWCADQSPYRWHERPCEVLLFDRTSRKELTIASGLPRPPIDRWLFHIDPHPQFTPRGTCVAYTTTVRGDVDVALAPVARALESLHQKGAPIGTSSRT